MDTTVSQSADTTEPEAVVRLDGSAHLGRELLGNKGYGIDAMRRHGLPVPPAFAITTEAGRRWLDDPVGQMERIWPEVVSAVEWLEAQTSKGFGSSTVPLLVSVRSGAAQSMPGMMDTVLDLGIDDSVTTALAGFGGSVFAEDTRRRFHNMFRTIVLGGDGTVPEDPWVQLKAAIEAVFASWNSPRARTYRDHHGLSDAAGTAVVVQAMVFGNLDERSGTGVLFTRNPMTGDDAPFGEWLSQGQGEDIVSGSRDCDRVAALADAMPEVYEELLSAATTLENLAADVQDIEFTVEGGRLWILQTRNAKRSATASVRFALSLHRTGMIDAAEVIRRIDPTRLAALTSRSAIGETLTDEALLCSGLPASPGTATGRAVTDSDEALDLADDEDVVLLRTTTSPDDIHGMIAAVGIVTEIGGATSHAAVVSREIGKPAVVGCGPGLVDSLAGKIITVDGDRGRVYLGRPEADVTSAPATEADLAPTDPDLIELGRIAATVYENHTGPPAVGAEPVDASAVLDLLGHARHRLIETQGHTS